MMAKTRTRGFECRRWAGTTLPRYAVGAVLRKSFLGEAGRRRNELPLLPVEYQARPQ